MYIHVMCKYTCRVKGIFCRLLCCSKRSIQTQICIEKERKYTHRVLMDLSSSNVSLFGVATFIWIILKILHDPLENYFWYWNLKKKGYVLATWPLEKSYLLPQFVKSGILWIDHWYMYWHIMTWPLVKSGVLWIDRWWNLANWGQRCKHTCTYYHTADSFKRMIIDIQNVRNYECIFITFT